MFLWNNGLTIFTSPHRSLTCLLRPPKSTALPHPLLLLRGIPGNAPFARPYSPVGKSVTDTYYLTSRIGYIAHSRIAPGEAIASKHSRGTGSDRTTASTTSPTAAFLDGKISRYSTHNRSWIRSKPAPFLPVLWRIAPLFMLLRRLINSKSRACLRIYGATN